MPNNEELKLILQKRVDELENSSFKEEKFINEESVKILLKNLSLPNDFLPLAKRVFELSKKTKLIWLHLCECTGCTESMLRSANPDFAEFIFDFFSLDYHETLMGANGFQAEDLLDEILEQDYILAVEGGVAPIDTYFLTIGAHGESGYDLLKKSAKNAKAIFAIGTCSSYGGIQAANPNPSKTCGISEVLNEKVVNIPGCPPSDINIISNLAFYVLFKILPDLDKQNRPLWAYGKCLHDMCERKAKFESGEFAQNFGDELSKNGACLFKLGCKGPYTYNNCPKVKFNAKTSWPVAAGRGCMACSEKNFWDDFGIYEKPMSNIFAYTNFSNQNSKFINQLEIKNITSNDIVLSFTDDTKVFYLKDGEIFEDLELCFETNLKLIFENISKNKLGAKLIQNYKDNFGEIYEKIMQMYDENSIISSDIKEFFNINYLLAKGERLKDIKDFFDLSNEYKFKHASPYDFKISFLDEKSKLDISKSLRMPLIYLCGGLDLQALAYSCISALMKSIANIAIKNNKQNIYIDNDKFFIAQELFYKNI